MAKLAGILMAFPGMNLSIEGFTDSTGSNRARNRRVEVVLTQATK